MNKGDGEGLHGVIESSVFLGLSTHYFVKIGEKVVEVLQTEAEEILPEGTAVALTVKEKCINVFRKDGEETLIKGEEL